MTEAHSRCIGGPSPILRALLFYSTAFWGDLEKRHNTVGGRINFAWFVFTEFHDKLKLNLCSSRHPKKKNSSSPSTFFSSKGVVVEQQLLLDVSSCRFQKTSLKIMIKKLVKHLSNLIDLSNFKFGPMMLVYFIL